MSTTAPRTRTGCTSCRVRHLKCDESKPVCRRCLRAGRECVRGYNVRFRYGTDLGGDDPPTGGRAAGGKGGEFRFEADQVWINTPGIVSFVDETGDVTRNYDSSGFPSLDPSASQSAAPFPVQISTNRSVSIHNLISSPPLASPASDGGSSSVPRRRNSITFSPTDEPILPRELDQFPRDIGVEAERRSNHPHPRMPLQDILIPSLKNPPVNARALNEQMDEDRAKIPSLHLSQTMWPLPARDAKLLRHYITHLGKWFDMHDNLGHFQTVVPLNSATCPMLMNAILALAARQLSHTSDDYDALVASHYHQSCLELYIPALSSVGPNNLDPSLLAATVLLRAFRELDGPYTEEEEPYLPSKLFSTLHLNPSISSDLRQACFWTYLRQDINTSFVSRQPIKTNLNNLHLDRTFSSVDDATWANRITFHCASILQFAFGAQSPPSQASAAWTRLSNEVETWRKSRPHGFEPIFHSPCDPEKRKYFPEISFARDCHATGTQYYHLCRILLALYNPGFPGIAKGPRGVQEASRKVAEEVRVEVRAICGIAKSNRTVVPAWLLACRAVAVGAVWFEEEKERREMLGLLVETEREVGFPMEKVRRECERLWGMEGEGEGEELVKRE